MRQARKMSPSQPGRADPVEELLALPAEIVPDLPLPVTLWLELEGAPARVLFTTRERASPAGSASSMAWVPAMESLADVIIFDREEVRALAIATQADRMWRKDLLGLCFDKWRKPEHRLTVDAALAGANPDVHDWTLSRVLARLGASIQSVEAVEHGTREVRELSAAA